MAPGSFPEWTSLARFSSRSSVDNCRCSRHDESLNASKPSATDNFPPLAAPLDGADDLQAAGLSRRKVATLRDLAQHFADGRLDEGSLASLPDDEVEAQPTRISGIGPWTVHGALIIALDREDVVLPGDLALRKAIQRTYGLDHVPSPDEILAIAEPWRPFRTLATSYLFASALEPVRA